MRERIRGIGLGLVTRERGSALRRMQIIGLGSAARHDVAGSEAEESASSGGEPFGMTNVPYLKCEKKSRELFSICGREICFAA